MTKDQPIPKEAFLDSQDEPVLIQQLPCRVEYNGEANVDKYLSPDGDLEASFRGRALKGVKLQIDDGYKAVVLDDHVITKQREILVYGHDFKPDRSTPSMNVNLWIQMAQQVSNILTRYI